MMASSQPANNVAVEVNELTKKFGDFTAVDHVSFEVPQGRIFGFLGPNGAGKTTTIRMLLGLTRPTAGSAVTLGYRIPEEAGELRPHIGYMSQQFSLYNDLTVEENLNFYGGIYDVTGQELRRRKQYIIDMADLKGREKQLTGNLSGGWKQRLALGVAIIHRPEMLFLDEPTAGVDPISRRQFWDLLYELAEEGTTIMVTTHYMDEAEHCQDLIFMQAGRLVAMGTPEAIKEKKMDGQVLEVAVEQPDRAVTLLDEAERFRDVSIYGNLIHVVTPNPEEDRDHIREILKEDGLTVQAIDRIAPSLEDVFIASTQRQDSLAGKKEKSQ
jgi:ABC-2 type transport system ATP-binding protein